MILSFRPELQNPPMDKEATIGFTFIDGNGNSEHIQVAAGVNREFPVEIWQKIESYPVVQSLLSLGAFKIVDEKEADTIAKVLTPATDSISEIAINDALGLIDDSFDPDQLRRWDAKESRIRVKNAIARRLTAITEGKG